jgi:hypothetical protein
MKPSHSSCNGFAMRLLRVQRQRDRRARWRLVLERQMMPKNAEKSPMAQLVRLLL